MKSQTTKPKAASSPKARRPTPPSPAAPLLTVTLNAENSALVRAWAEIVHRAPVDAANGLLADTAYTLRDYRADEKREGKRALNGEESAVIEERIREAAKQRETQISAAGGGAAEPHARLHFTITGATASAFSAMAEDDGKPPGAALFAMVNEDLAAWMETRAQKIRVGQCLPGKMECEVN